MNNIIQSPAKPIATPSTKPSGKGTVNGEEGLPKRTSSPNAVDEVNRDGALPSYKMTDIVMGPAKGVK